MIRAESQRRHLRAALLILTVALSGPTVADDKHPSDLASIDLQVEQAVTQGDLEQLRQIYTEDFRFTHSTGEVQSKDQWLAFVAGRPFASRIVSDVQVERHENTALTAGRIAVTERSPPGGRYTLSYVRLYVLVDGLWRMASHRTIEMRDEQ